MYVYIYIYIYNIYIYIYIYIYVYIYVYIYIYIYIYIYDRVYIGYEIFKLGTPTGFSFSIPISKIPETFNRRS